MNVVLMPNNDEHLMKDGSDVVINLALEDFNIDFHTYLTLQLEIFKNITNYIIDISDDKIRNQMTFSQNILLSYKQKILYRGKKVSFTNLECSYV